MEDESHNVTDGIPTQPWVITVIQIYRCVRTIESTVEHVLSNNTRSKTEEKALEAKFARPRCLDRILGLCCQPRVCLTLSKCSVHFC